VKVNHELAAQGLRVLALAHRSLERPEPADTAGSSLIFSGFAAMLDPPREEVKAAVAKCRTAGIKPVMITGDHPSTAIAIARELGIAAPGDRVITGKELSALAEADLEREVQNTAVYARVSPEHKLKIIRSWKKLGRIVAMTGDGVNDAPAIKEADIGIAMGITGTDVTKKAADLVLLDDRFSTIVSAIEEGRSILRNIQKVLHYLLAGYAGELLVMFTASLFNLPFPLLATQLLWINFVTDGFPALALSREPGEAGIMQAKPRPPDLPLLTWESGTKIVIHGSLIAAVVLGAFLTVYRGETSRLAEARATAFCTLAVAHVLFAMNCRDDRRSVFSLKLSSNPWLLGAVIASLFLQLLVMVVPLFQGWFDISVPLSRESWQKVLGFSLLSFIAIEVPKLRQPRSHSTIVAPPQSS
jgi:Ca2+-transporting ATPase